MFYFPAGEYKGVLIVQRFKQHGIYELLSEYVDLMFKGEFNKVYRLEKNVLTNSDILNKMIQDAQIREVSFIQTEWSDDLADEIHLLPKEKRGSIKVSISAARNSVIPLKKKIKKLFSGELNPNQIIELENAGFNISPDEVKVDLYLNGRSRTISYSDSYSLRSVFDITDDVEFGENGHPTFSSVDEHSLDILETMSKQLYQGSIRE